MIAIKLKLKQKSIYNMPITLTKIRKLQHFKTIEDEAETRTSPPSTSLLVESQTGAATWRATK